jgi:hypothetical protein
MLMKQKRLDLRHSDITVWQGSDSNEKLLMNSTRNKATLPPSHDQV